MFLIYLAAVAGTIGSEISQAQAPTDEALMPNQRDADYWRVYCRAAGREAANRAMRSPTRRLKPPTADQMIHCTGDEMFGDYERNLDRIEHTARPRDRSVDQMVREQMTGPDGIHMPPIDMAPAHAEVSAISASEAAYTKKQTERSTEDRLERLEAERGFGAAATGAIGLLVGAIAAVLLVRRRVQPTGGGATANPGTPNPPSPPS